MSNNLPAVKPEMPPAAPENPLEGQVLKHPEWKVPSSILITQCCEEDFLRTLLGSETAPTIVHVGRFEAERLCGPAGTMIDFLLLAHRSSPETLGVLHICDEHDPQLDAAHYERFGAHCPKGGPGAALVGGLDDLVLTRPNTMRIKGADLNDVHGSDLVPALKQLLEGRDLSEVRVGVVGVWTNVKVAYLIRDLITELGAKQVATCSSLTASNDIEAHYNALSELESVLGVKVFHSHVSLLRWLDSEAKVALPEAPKDALSYTVPERAKGILSSRQVSERDALIGAALESVDPGGKFELKPLGGGFSGSQVFVARSDEKVMVAKIGERNEVAHERFANERMMRRLRGYVPNILAYREGPTMAALIQELAQPSSEHVEGPFTFQELAQKHTDSATTSLLASTLEETFDGAMGGCLRTASLTNIDLFRAYGFTDGRGKPQYVDSVTKKAFGLARRNGFEDVEALFHHVGMEGAVCTPAQFYREWLPGRAMIRETLRAPVHGDLNLVNILLSREAGSTAPENLWIIDWARLSQMPALTDFAKIENDLSYIVLPLDGGAAFKRALKMQEARLQSRGLDLDGFASLAETPEELRYATLVTTLRHLAAEVDDRGTAAMEGYRLALLRYGAHTLGFPEPNHAQRTLALCGVGRLCGLIRESNGTQKVGA